MFVDNFYTYITENVPPKIMQTLLNKVDFLGHSVYLEEKIL